MTRSGWLLAILVVLLLTAIAAFLAWVIFGVSLPCGDRGGDIYWASGFRHVCIDHRGLVLP